MKRIIQGILMVKEWLGLSGSQSWPKFIRAIRTLCEIFRDSLVEELRKRLSKQTQSGVPLINGGLMGRKHLDSWSAFTHLAVRRNAKSSWRLSSINQGSFAVRQLDTK